ncbi:MAG: glycosyltransferase [Bacteroidetes bacterium]|nr:glycosyltransferase [Bacteroidota bacterium]
MTADHIALVCPLDWGIGHATRCVPVIGMLQAQGFKVIVAADKRPYEFFRTEYPEVELMRFPGMKVRYPSGSAMAPAMAATIPALLLSISKEHKLLAKLVKETNARLVVSDNRYGCWHPYVKSVFMTHQLNIQLPSFLKCLSPVLRKINYSFINKYSECWIPDAEDEGGLSGRLSHCIKLPGNCHFIGPLTRFAAQIAEPATLPCPPADIFAMISGPEPQRSKLESIIINQLKKTTYTAIIAGGRTGATGTKVIGDRIHIFPHLSTALMKYYIEKADHVICRSGYSTLMDLAALGKTAILVPTPGQTEQEYLAGRLSKMNIHYAVIQAKFSLEEALMNSKGNKAIVIRNDMSVLKQRIKRLYAQAASLRVR